MLTTGLRLFGLSALMLGHGAVLAADPNREVSTPEAQAACRQQPYWIDLVVANVRDAKGLVTVDLHGDDPKKFLKSGMKLARIRVPAEAGATRVCVAVDKPGTYALALYHDRDGDFKLDKTWIGLPDEPFALSNNPALRLAMPKHDDSAFRVEGPGTPIEVSLGRRNSRNTAQNDDP